MSSPSDEQFNLQRRDFLRLLSSGAFVLAVGEVLTGCGGGGGGNTSTPAGTKTVSGTVNTTEIGGANLTVLSATKSSAAVTTQGQFTTLASSQGSQFLVVTDGSGKLRGLSISNPQGSSTVTFSAASTASALVLLTPGILTVDPATMAQRIQQINGLSSFSPFVSYLTQNLPSKSLNDLQQDTTLEHLKTNCINDWLAQYGGRNVSIYHGRAAGDPAFSAQFTSPPTVASNLTNNGWRFLSIVREDLDANGNSLRLTPLNFHNGFPAQALGLFDGVTAVGWGSIFSGMAGSPANDSDTTIPATLTDIPNIASVKYWIYGPGNPLLNNVSNAPNGLESKFNEVGALGASFVYYALFPLIDAALGIAGLVIKEVNSGLWQSAFAAQAVWAAVQGSINTASLIQAFQKGDTKGLVSALIDLLAALIGAIGTILDALIKVGVLVLEEGAGLAVAVEVIGGFLAAISIAFTTANAGIMAATWLGQYPTIANVQLSVSGAGVTVQ